MQKGRSLLVPPPSPPWWAPGVSPYVEVGGSSSVFPGQQEGGAGLGRAGLGGAARGRGRPGRGSRRAGQSWAGDSLRSSPVSSGTSTLCCANVLFALQGPAYRLHGNTRDTLARLEIAELVHFPQSRD